MVERPRDLPAPGSQDDGDDEFPDWLGRGADDAAADGPNAGAAPSAPAPEPAADAAPEEGGGDRPARPFRSVRVRPRTRPAELTGPPVVPTRPAPPAPGTPPAPSAVPRDLSAATSAARDARDGSAAATKQARRDDPPDRPRIVDPSVRPDRADRPVWTDPSFNRPAPRAPRRDSGRQGSVPERPDRRNEPNRPADAGHPRGQDRAARPEQPGRPGQPGRSERFSKMPEPRGVRPAPAAGPGKATGERNPSLPPQKGPRTPPRQPLTAARGLSPMQSSRTPQYLVIGHICADLTPQGTVVLGGTALYSALTAARLGWRVGVLTRGAFGGEFAGMQVPSLDGFGGEISIICQDAEVPTTFINVYKAGRREQTMPHWAGPIDLRGLPPHWRNARVIHLGPIAQEIDQKQTGALTPQFLGITPQGWMREWPRPEGGRVRITHLRLTPELINRTDGVIVSIEEITQSRDIVERIGAQRLGVITKGESGARVIYGGESIDLPGFNVPTVDLTGAGDVFAAAFFTKAADRSISALNAGRFANAVAALSLRGVGVSAVPSLADVEALLAANRGR